MLPLLSPARRTWLTVRNDDIYNFRWADPEFARAFIKAIPGPDKIAGFYMGSDGYICGRDFLTKDADSSRQTVLQKQWLSFTLWGRAGLRTRSARCHLYPARRRPLPGGGCSEALRGVGGGLESLSRNHALLLGRHRSQMVSRRRAWSHPSTRAFTRCAISSKAAPCPGSGVLNILGMAGALRWLVQKPDGVTPLEIAAVLEANAARALQELGALRSGSVPVGNAKEYGATLGDIEAMSQLGLYYAAKIRGACDLARFDKSGDSALQGAAVQHLETALAHWKEYAAAYTPSIASAGAL